MITVRGRQLFEENLLQSHSVHHKSTWTALGLISGHLDEKPEANCLSDGTDYH
jgi:hypothetical protein